MPGQFPTLALTAFALIAFAANSVLCRLALGGRTIDAASFTLLRIGSGAAMLAVIRWGLRARKRGIAATAAHGAMPPARRSWTPALMLFLYAAPFSFAYLSLAAGTGALILFGAVQATMILAALRSGERFSALEGIGLCCALGGLLCLVFPGLRAPSPAGSALMAGAGIAWGIYTLRGRGSDDSVGDTGRNFVRTAPFAVLVSLATVQSAHVAPEGALLAIISGAVTSGLGYAVWYAALGGLTAIRAATVQLTVPALAAAGGVMFLGERVTVRLVLSAILILGGVGLALAGRRKLEVG